MSGEPQKIDIHDLEDEIYGILNPEPDEPGDLPDFPPHPRFSSIHGLDISYYHEESQIYDPKYPTSVVYINRDRTFERVLRGASNPLHKTLDSISVPDCLLQSALQVFGDSLIEYHENERRWNLYRFYPSILVSVWSAFEAWVRINSEIFVTVVPTLPRSIADALLEVRSVVKKNGEIKLQPERRPVLDRYWLLLKYGCNVEFDRGSRLWQAGREAALVRDSLVHYDVSKAPSLTSFEVWNHMESVMLLFIVPSTLARRTLFQRQFYYYYILAQLHPLISEFEERPSHKKPPRDASLFDCPFDGVDESKYPSRWKKV